MISLGGLLMALADSVPGVSGGTIAFLMGFYDDFIGSLNGIIFGKKPEKIKSLKFLVRLGIGWIIGFISAVLILNQIFESHIYNISSLFLGFIIFSIPIILIEERDVFKQVNVKSILSCIVGIAIVILITILNSSTTGDDTLSLNVGTLLYILIAGMVAISAMVLPGISGSTLLLIFGLYIPIMNYIYEFLHLNFEGVPYLMAFGIGVLLGIALVIKGVKYCLEHFRPQTMYCILGLMIGSLYAIVKGPETLDTPQPAMNINTFSILFFIIGGVVIFGLQLLKKYMSSRLVKANTQDAK